VRAAHIAVVGLGGVGSWTAEALARSGVGALTLVDLDHVSESNVNRQVQALGSTLGMAKTDALAARIADIHPGCRVAAVEEFVDESNWPGLLARHADVVVDACDDVRAKAGARRLGPRRRDAARQRRRRRRQARGRAGRGRRPWPMSRTTRCWPRCASA
jgi:tRNA A37 threonylcarbamoyladenosine dehydratase